MYMYRDRERSSISTHTYTTHTHTHTHTHMATLASSQLYIDTYTHTCKQTHTHTHTHTQRAHIDVYKCLLHLYIYICSVLTGRHLTAHRIANSKAKQAGARRSLKVFRCVCAHKYTFVRICAYMGIRMYINASMQARVHVVKGANLHMCCFQVARWPQRVGSRNSGKCKQNHERMHSVTFDLAVYYV